MSTADIHKNYLNRLKERRNDPFYRKQARWLIRRTAPEYQRTAREYETYLRREDLPESVKAQATIDQQQRWADVVGGISDKMEVQESNRRRELESKIDERQFRYDLAREEEEEKEEKAGKDIFGNIVSTVGSLAGAALTATGVGAPIGMAVSAGSAGLGAALSGSPEQQMALLDRAGQEALGAMGASATLKKDKSMVEGFGELGKAIETSDLVPQQKARAMGLVAQQIAFGADPKDIINDLNSMFDMQTKPQSFGELKKPNFEFPNTIF